MGRIQSFLFGALVGGLLMFSSLKYHIIRAEDGVHFVPKLEANFSDIYVDIREFHLADWRKRRALAMALMKADKSELVQDSALGSLEQSAMDGLRTSIDGARREIFGE